MNEWLNEWNIGYDMGQKPILGQYTMQTLSKYFYQCIARVQHTSLHNCGDNKPQYLSYTNNSSDWSTL